MERPAPPPRPTSPNVVPTRPQSGFERVAGFLSALPSALLVAIGIAVAGVAIAVAIALGGPSAEDREFELEKACYEGGGYWNDSAQSCARGPGLLLP